MRVNEKQYAFERWSSFGNYCSSHDDNTRDTHRTPPPPAGSSGGLGRDNYHTILINTHGGFPTQLSYLTRVYLLPEGVISSEHMF